MIPAQNSPQASPGSSPQCSHLTREGKPCKGKVLPGRDVCRAHSMTEEEKAALREAAARARTERREAREHAEEAARKGLKALMGERLEERADALTARLEALALSPDDATALRGIELWLSRVHGRAVQPTRDETPDVPADVEALRSLSPEERRALLHALG